MRLVLAEEEHAGERRDAERRDAGAQEDAPAHVHHGLVAGMDVELIRAARARRIEQRVERQRRRVGRRLDDPELVNAGNSSP